MSLPESSTWLIERERDGKSATPDQKIRVTSTSGEQFTAEYSEIANPSVFTGEVWARQTKTINIKQHDHGSGYVAFHSGLRKGTNNNRYEGRWFDVAGNKGGFRLTRV